ncbi:MAG: GLUG motif-containing protein [Anaerohalosphaeraceae bacterium]
MKRIRIVLVGIVLVGLVGGSLAGTYGGGSGTAEDPYQIWTPEEMNTIGLNPGDWASHFKLMADIDMSAYTGTQYNIIGNDTTDFTGTFEGGRHIINNLTYITSEAVNNVGLFGPAIDATIKNLGVEHVSISSGGSCIGGLVGLTIHSSITSCYVTGSVRGTDTIGVLVGINFGSLTECYATGSVSGNGNIGGLVGYNGGTLIACYATSSVNGTSDMVGGLVGRNSNGTLTACYATGSVSGVYYVGGLVGYNDGSINTCFWDTQTSGQSLGVGAGDSTGLAGETTAQMQTLSTFTDAGWDFTDTDGDPAEWRMPSNNYPHLAWEPYNEGYGGGSGTAEDPYQIWTAEQMNAVGANPGDWESHFRLIADIDMSAYTSTQYNIIGNNTQKFTGTFDGNGHKIRNLTYTTSEDTSYVGLFGRTNNAVICNLGIENISLSTGGSYVGAVAGWNGYGSTITACYTTGSISGKNYVGGLSGVSSGTLTTCYASDSVSGINNIGGLVGYNHPGVIASCYAVGSVSGTGLVGGLAGWNSTSSTITACFWDTQTSGQMTSAGGIGKTTAEMQMLSTFIDAGWDFTQSDGDPAEWWMPTNNYPQLAWEPYHEGYGGGRGTPEDPYQIANKADLFTLAANQNDYIKCFILTADIDLSGENFSAAVIAPDTDAATSGFQGTKFTGIFDGNDKKISNLSIMATNRGWVGLFGYLGSDGQIKNLGVVDTNIEGGDYSGGLVGMNNNGTITSCYTTGTMRGSGGSYVGGLVGENKSGTLTFCYATVTVNGAWSVGGLAGHSGDTITSCYATGTVSGDSSVGGLAGYNGGMITSCYATGAVSGNWVVGGLVGLQDSGFITSCYSTGLVTASSSSSFSIGGLVGTRYYDGIITLSFWNTQTSGKSISAGGTGKTTAEMKTLSTFTSEGWDFSVTDGDAADWYMPVDSYPQLKWQQWVVVPNIVGLLLADAQSSIFSAELQVGSITMFPSNSIPKWTVISQSPASGQTISGTTTVNIVVSMGPPLPGSGTAENPYQIWTAEQMYSIGFIPEEWNKNYILMADVDMSAYTETIYMVIGSPTLPFTGIFDGSGHTISNAVIHQLGNDYVSLFGYIGMSGLIKNLGVMDADIQGRSKVSELVGYNGGTISSCYATGSVNGNSSVGGLVGYNYGTIISCYAMGTTSGKSQSCNVGGLVGENESGTITSCYATGAVSGNGNIGGLVGSNSGRIISCYVRGAVSGNGSVGGLAGYNNSGTITSCDATGAVSGNQAVGGLVGVNGSGGILTSCYATGTVSGITHEANVGGLSGSNYGTITSCYAMGATSGKGQYCNVGGLVGENESGKITSCYATGTVSGTERVSYVGGLVGHNKSGTITSCYAMGATSGSYYSEIGGLVGQNYTGTISSCFATGSVSETGEGSDVGGLVGRSWGMVTTMSGFWDIQTSGQTMSAEGEGKTNSQMQTLTTFTSAGWDFTTTWAICEGTNYPRFLWQIPAGDFVCPDGVFIEDLLYLSSRWLESSLEAYASADRTGDGKVNLDDYALLAEQWMSGVELMPSMTYKVGECDTGSVLSAGNPLRFTVKVDGRFIDFEDLIFANCCIEKGIRLEMMVEGRVITLTETELSEGICNCVCNYPTTARMGPFEPGTYTVQVDQINYSGYITPIGQMEIVISSDQ